MSTLRTNTLQDAAGNNSVPMATVASGTAKACVNFYSDIHEERSV